MFTKTAYLRISKYSKLSKNYLWALQKPLSEEFIKEINPLEEIIITNNIHCEKIMTELQKKPKNLVIVSGKSPLFYQRF